MSYSDYQYPSSGTSYESYSQQYDTQQPYSSRDQHGQFVQYDYTSSPSLDQYAKPTATVLADYRGYSNPVADTGYTSTPVLSYPDSTSTHTPYQYSQDTLKVDQFAARSYVPSDSASVSFSTPVPHYASGTTPQEQTSSQPVTDYSSYQYQSTDYNQPSSSYGQERSSLGHTGTYNQNSSGYSYQDTPSQLPNTWTSSTNQYTSYNTGYYGESASSTSYSQKVESGLGNTGYSPSVDRYSQSTSGDNVCCGYSQPDSYSVTDGRSSSYLGYVKPVSNQVSKPQQSFGGYPSSSRFDIGSENISGSKSYSSESGGGFGVATLSSPNYSSGGGRGDFRGRDKSNVVNRGGSNRFSYAKNSSFPTQTTSTQKSFNNQSGGGSSFSAHSFSNRGNRDGVFSSRGSFPTSNHGDRRSNVSKPPLGTFDARNKINEARSASAIQSKVATPVLAPNKNNVLVSSYKPPEATKKEVFKAPSRPQDRLLNEIEEKEKAQRAEELKKSEEEQKKAAEKRLQTLEEEKKQAEEALKKKVADEAVKAAPPNKPPETAEEIAHEEEIQRKIRESVVIISPEQETALLKDDPSQDIEMSEELRKLVKTLTTDYLCKLCSVRIVGTQMAAMHYNGKNHAKKLRNFVQTNGRSAGFNLDTLNVAGNGEQKEEVGEKKAEVVEITVMETAICWRTGQG